MNDKVVVLGAPKTLDAEGALSFALNHAKTGAFDDVIIIGIKDGEGGDKAHFIASKGLKRADINWVLDTAKFDLISGDW